MTQFKGETNWDAIVHDNSLDIEEEDSFAKYLQEAGFTGDLYKVLPLVRLEKYYKHWRDCSGSWD